MRSQSEETSRKDENTCKESLFPEASRARSPQAYPHQLDASGNFWSAGLGDASLSCQIFSSCSCQGLSQWKSVLHHDGHCFARSATTKTPELPFPFKSVVRGVDLWNRHPDQRARTQKVWPRVLLSLRHDKTRWMKVKGPNWSRDRGLDGCKVEASSP